jgi:hypothetical protein
MTRTSQLDAHYAVIQIDNLLRQVVMSFRPTCDMLIAEVRERAPGEAGRQRLRGLLTRYRGSVLEVSDTLVALRGQCGTDPDDLPDAEDDDVREELARIREAHDTAESAKRQPTRRFVPCSPELAAAADDALDALRAGGAF